MAKTLSDREDILYDMLGTKPKIDSGSNTYDALYNSGSIPDNDFGKAINALFERYAGKIGNNDDITNLRDAILSYILELDRRKYNESQEALSRDYNDPLNQLSRLMATGMSRDAALQAISGVPGQAVSGESSDIFQGNVASTQALNTAQMVNSYFSTAQSAIDTFGSALSIGMSIPQIQMMRNQAKLSAINTDDFVNARNLSNSSWDAIIGANIALLGSGYEMTNEDFASPDSMINWYRKNAGRSTMPNRMKDIDAMMRDPGAFNLFGSRYGSYMSQKGFKQTEEDARQYRANLATQYYLDQMNVQQMAASLDYVNQHYANLFEDEKFDAYIKQFIYDNKLEDLIYQGDVRDHERVMNLLRQRQLEISNGLSGNDLAVSNLLTQQTEDNWEWISANDLMSLQKMHSDLKFASNPTRLEKEHEFQIQHLDGLLAEAKLGYLQTRVGTDLAKNHPWLFNLINTFNQPGMSSAVQAAGSMFNAGQGLLTPSKVGTQIVYNGSLMR